MPKIVINPGHCGCEPGAVSGSFTERDLNLKVAGYMAEILGEYEAEVILTRTENKPCNGVHIADVIALAEREKADLIFSVHHNAGGGAGTEVYYQPDIPQSKRLAEAVLSECVKIGRKPRGIKNGKAFRLLGGTGITAVMTEYAFLDSADRAAVDSDEKLRTEAKAMAAAVAERFSLKKKAPQNPDEPLGTELFRVGKAWSGGKCVGQIGAFRLKSNAVSFCRRGYRVFDENGKEVFANPADESQRGDKITLKNAALYTSSTAEIAARHVSGTYYIYDGVKIGGRYRITLSPAMCGKTPAGSYVTGYVEGGAIY